ncbi:MAG: hypothetical protein CMN21_24770 [Rubinisphaera sp.]|nr:hypothetical protein [Rubinisphaera sp.]
MFGVINTCDYVDALNIDTVTSCGEWCYTTNPETMRRMMKRPGPCYVVSAPITEVEFKFLAPVVKSRLPAYLMAHLTEFPNQFVAFKTVASRKTKGFTIVYIGERSRSSVQDWKVAPWGASK